jgi:RNA polymerase sigma factor (sigma-70 family)
MRTGPENPNSCNPFNKPLSNRPTTLSTLEYFDLHTDLAQRCLRGERQAQQELYRLYSRAMYNICLRMLRTEADAEDVLQHSFVDVFTKLHTFRSQSTIGSWIKRIVVNNCINHLKKQRVRFDELDERMAGHLEDEVYEPPDEQQQFQVQRIKQAMHQLPDGYRAVFSLYLLEGYDHQEIAEILGISEATSKSQFSRARQKIRALLETHV